MAQLEFANKQSAVNSEIYKKSNFYRFYKNMITGKYIIETKDYGTSLSHHDLIKLGKHLSIKNQSKMAPKKATPAQLEARKRFAEMAKNGTLAKKRGLKAPAKKKSSKSARSLCRQVIDVAGINKRTGQLLKGWHYVDGKPVKVTSKKKPATKKKPVAKKKVSTVKKKTAVKSKPKFLGIF